MRLRATLLIMLAGILASCSGSRSSLSESDARSAVRPMELYIDSDLANSHEFSTSVAKVYRGNGFTQSGVFISNDGLFITNFPIALEYFTTSSQSDLEWLTNGYLADELHSELVLPGVSLMIEVEQRDISIEYNSKINENSSNVEIAQVKQSVTQEIVQAERLNDPELVVQINELFNGQRFILSKYKVINDVRLVFAPATGISSDDITSTKDLVSKIENLPVVLRAYSDDQPFTPISFLQLSASGASIEHANVLGFPDRSFRLDPHQALKFYNESTNPNIIKAYSAFLSKEERLSWKNSQYAHQSMSNRVNIEQNLNFYKSVQSSFLVDSIYSRKKEFDNELLTSIQSDSLSDIKYGGLFHYLRQAYEIADRQGSSFYASSYFLALSQLDEFALIVREYLNAPEDEEATSLERLLNGHTTLLSRTNVQEELLQLADFITIFSELPEAQIPFSIQDIFEELPNATPIELAEYVLTKYGNETALLDGEKLALSIENNLLSNDPLFILLDELIFTQEMSRNNQSIFIAYAQPVQKVYNDAIRDIFNNDLITSDANGILRANSGSVIRENDATILEGLFNFTTKAPGSAVINNKGELVGIIGDKNAEDMSTNYLFLDTPQSYSVIDLSFILDEIEAIIQD